MFLEASIKMVPQNYITLDSENMNGVRRVVQELAKDRQIIYFTCHETREV